MDYIDNINYQTTAGKTALMFVAAWNPEQYDIIDAVALLLSKKADPDLFDNKGNTALITLINNYEQHTANVDVLVDIIECFKQHGANILHANNKKFTAVDLAKRIANTIGYRAMGEQILKALQKKVTFSPVFAIPKDQDINLRYYK